MTQGAQDIDVQVRGTEELGAVLREYMQVTDRLQRTHETLQREVIRLRDELASKNRELEVRRRLASLGELAAGVAHEVRNPLGAIQLYSGLLRRECRQVAPALDLIAKIEAGIAAIDDVVRDTLSLAPRPGRLAPQRLEQTLHNVRDLCQQKLAERQVSLHIELADERVCVLSEGDGLQRVLVNLVNNAADASAPGSMVEVRVGPPEDGEIELCVLDEGVGLSNEALDRLFDPFFTTKEHGTGLGLTIAHRLVEALGGRLMARNRPHGGAEFVVVLPSAGEVNEEGMVNHEARQIPAA